MIAKNITKTSYTVKNLSENKNYYYKMVITYTNKSKQTSGILRKRKINGDYCKKNSVYGVALSLKELDKVKDKVADFVNVYITEDMSEFDKIKTAHDYLCKICVYQDWYTKKANTAYGVLVYKGAACSGYARAYKALCDGMGIDCYYVKAAPTAFNPSHQWNFVKIHKKWYVMDVQCDDSSGWYASFLIGAVNKKGYNYNWISKGMPSISKENYK